jgi:methionyl-tRNA formyltransferase
LKTKILFLGPSDSPIIKWLLEKGENIYSTKKKVTKEFILKNEFEFLITYGYRFILKKEILNLFPSRAINLHISYLPYNRGADPNFWSFIDDTPKGVTIHYLDEGIDSGDIIVQKKIHYSSLNSETLSSSYNKLHSELQKLFFENWDSIKNFRNNRTIQSGNSTFHKSKDKESLFHLIKTKKWNTELSILVNYTKNLKK